MSTFYWSTIYWFLPVSGYSAKLPYQYVSLEPTNCAFHVANPTILTLIASLRNLNCVCCESGWSASELMVVRWWPSAALVYLTFLAGAVLIEISSSRKWPAYAAIALSRRRWRRRVPLLTRLDFTQAFVDGMKLNGSVWLNEGPVTRHERGNQIRYFQL